MAYERGNRHLVQLWGKVQPRRESVKFRIGNDKLEMPVRTPAPETRHRKTAPHANAQRARERKG
eukprot:1003385-Rhodomonas_salina.3